MSTTGDDGGAAAGSGEGPESPENRLFGLYRRFIGEPDADADVYLGFGLFFAGAALALAGVALFFLGAAVDDPGTFWALRELAGVTGATGLPLLLLAVPVLLPVDRRATLSGAAGLAVCLVAVAVFVQAYPTAWNVPAPRDRSALGVGVYALGIVVVIASAGAALVGHQVERAGGPAATGTGGSAAATGGLDGDADANGAPGSDDGEVTAERARRDYEEAMSGADVNWGGVERPKGTRLKLDTGAVEDADRSGFDGVEAETTRSASDVDDAVDALRGLKGAGPRTASGGGTDEQAAALRELRERQESREEGGAEESVVDRLRDLLS